VKKILDRRLSGGLVVTAVGVLFTTIALAAFLPSNSIVIAVRRGDNQPLELSLDVDATLASQRQDGQARNLQPFQALFQGDVHGTIAGH
jgi:hypothetical protein